MRRFLPSLVCVVALAIVAQPAVAVYATWGEIVLMPGDNWISAPVIPFDPVPTSVFAGFDIANNLTYFDPLTQTSIVYDPAHPELFPNVLIGDGYMLHNYGSSAVTLRYQGVCVDDTDIWISLPGPTGGGGGTHWFGITYLGNTSFDDVIVVDGYDAYSAAEAAALGWLDPVWTTMNASTQTIERIGATGQQGVDSHLLRGGHMYKVQTYQSNLALILKAPPVPEPSSLTALAAALGGFVGLARRRIRR